MTHVSFCCALVATVALTGCGGGESTTPPALDQAVGGLMIGHYAETSSTDPDRAVGGMYVDLPNDDGLFQGQLSYHYDPCQDSNQQSVVGTKLTRYLNGTITGRLDNQSAADQLLTMTLDGSYSRSSGSYTGNYSRTNRSNQLRTPATCNFSYTVSNQGRFEIFPESVNAPSSFVIRQGTLMVLWPAVSQAHQTLIMLLDPSKTGGGQGLVSQQYVNAPNLFATITPPSSSAKTYVVSVQVFDINNRLLAIDQARMTF